MPFPDEAFSVGVTLTAWDPRWPEEAEAFAAVLAGLGPDALAVEHIGSTAVPGLVAKDCLDMMIVVADLGATRAAAGLSAAGLRRRPEPWNQAEPAQGVMWPKMVFAPPAGGRSVNVHVRLADAPTTRRALLFRDFLRAEPTRAGTWSALKQAASAASCDLFEYGAIKDPAWLLLMVLAEQWAARVDWGPAFASSGRAGEVGA